MPRTLGAKDKKKRKKRLLNIALGVGGVAALGGLGYLALRKKMPTVGGTSRPTAYPDIQVRNTAASSPPPRISSPESIPVRAEIQSITGATSRSTKIIPVNPTLSGTTPPTRIVSPQPPKLLPSGKTTITPVNPILPNPTTKATNPIPVTTNSTIKALPPGRSQPQILKPKLIPTRAEVQISSINPIQTTIPQQPKLLPPARTPQTIRDPRLIPSRIEVKPSSIPNETPKLLPPAKTSQPPSNQQTGNTQNPNTGQPKSSATKKVARGAAKAANEATKAAKESAKAASEAWEAAKPATEAGGKLARKGIKAAGKVARRSNKGRKKLIIKGIKKVVKASVSDRSQGVIKKIASEAVDNLPVAAKVAGKVAKVAKDIDDSVQIGRRGFLTALGVKAAIAAKKQAAGTAQAVRRHPMTELFGTVRKTRAERLAEIRAARAARVAKANQPPNPLIQPHKQMEKVEKTIMEVEKASDLAETAGAKSLTRRELLKAPRQYLEDYITANPEKRIPALVNYFWKKGVISNNMKQFIIDKYSKGLHPTTSMRLAKILMDISDATGLYSDGQELAEFINED